MYRLLVSFVACLVLCGATSESSAQGTTVLEIALAARSAAVNGMEIGEPHPMDQLETLQRIVIDPGHGGLNEGAIGVGDTHEKHLTLAVAMHLADRLRLRYPDVDVVLTRQSDVDVGLSERAELANQLDADLFISLHFNAALNTSAAGFETYWVQDSRPLLPRNIPEPLGLLQILPELPVLCLQRQKAAGRARAFAHQVNAELDRRFDVTDRGVKQGNFTVLRRADVPAVVVEFGFLTHAHEGLEMLSPTNQARMVDALVDAIGVHDDALEAEGTRVADVTFD